MYSSLPSVINGFSKEKKADSTNAIIKTSNIELTNLPRAYKDRLVYSENLMVFVDRTFKYRQLSNTVSADMLLDLIVLDLCAR